MLSDVQRCSVMFDDVRRCSAMFGDVRRCSAMFDDVRRGSARFGDVIRCSAMLSELQFTIVTDSGGEFKLDMKYIQAAIPNWSGDLDTRHSTIGDGGTVAWKSRRQPTVAPVYYRGKVRGIRRLTPSWTTSHHKSSK